jgi:hypothetical protein
VLWQQLIDHIDRGSRACLAGLEILDNTFTRTHRPSDAYGPQFTTIFHEFKDGLLTYISFLQHITADLAPDKAAAN